MIGPWSDTFHTPLGRRRPFMLVAVGPMTFALALLAFMPNLWTTALMLSGLFFAYYVYEPPYRGLYPDVLPDNVFGRAQGVQHVFRGVAIGGALIGGGYLFHLWRPAPFLVAACVVAAACAVPIVFVTEDGGHGRVFEGVRTYVAHSWQVLRADRDVATFLVANTAWEGTFAGARTFVVLYVTVGLGEPLSTSTYILAAVAGGYIVAALVSGRIGDRIGLARVIAAEAEGEPFEGQVAVGAVILNRVNDPRFPNTLSGVIYQPHAFESVSNGLVWRRTPSAEAYRAARDALNGWDPT